MYMDRVYIPGQKLVPVYDMGLMQFRDNIVRDSRIHERLLSVLPELIDQQRSDDIGNKAIAKEIYQMLISLGIDNRSAYEEDFEKPFLNELADFYQVRSQKLLAQYNGLEYIHRVSMLVDETAQWTIDCFDQSTKEHVIRVLDEELITKHMATIVSMLNSDIARMITSNRSDELEHCYKTLERFSNGYLICSDCISQYLLDQGKFFGEQNEEDNMNACVQSLLELKDRFNHFLEIFTKYDQTLAERIKHNFQSIVNSNAHIATCLSSLIDEQLKKGVRCLATAEMIELFNMLILLHYWKDTDCVEERYQDFKQQLLRQIPDIDESKKPNGFIDVIENVLDAKDIIDMFLKTASNEDKVSSTLGFLWKLMRSCCMYMLQIFQEQLYSDLKSIVNYNRAIPKYLSLFIHEKLQKIDSDLIEQALEILFDKLMVLVDYLHEKDAFEQWYERHLARRLLDDKPMSDTMEKNMIFRLKTKCSFQFTSRLERMLSDIQVSKTMMNDFRSSIGLSVRVLMHRFWPVQSTNYQCSLPPLVNEAYRRFENFYLTKHAGRRLTLQSNLGTAVLAAFFNGEPKNADVYEKESQSTAIKKSDERAYSLQVSTHQMVILILFNARESWSFEVRNPQIISKAIALMLLVFAGTSTADEYQ